MYLLTMILVTHAGVDPGTVMIHLHHTTSTPPTVMGARCLNLESQDNFVSFHHELTLNPWHWPQNCSCCLSASEAGAQPGARNPGPVLRAEVKWYRVRLEKPETERHD